MRCIIAAAAALFLASPLAAQSTAKNDEVKMDETAKKATARALTWLAARQNPDGSWSDGRYAHNTAITSFCLLAFLSQGHLPNQGQYGGEVAKGMRFLLASQRDEDGYLVGARGGNMYCHGMATLALAELWGSTGEDTVKPVLKKAVELIVKCQNTEGGWSTHPWVLQELTMARDAQRRYLDGGASPPRRALCVALAGGRLVATR